MMQSSADTSVVLTSSQLFQHILAIEFYTNIGTSLSSIFWIPSYEEIKGENHHVDSSY